MKWIFSTAKKIQLPALVFMLSGLILPACKRTYLPPPTVARYNYLVIDGFIHGGNDTTQISLSRTIPLNDTILHRPETGAEMVIEGEDNTSYRLKEHGAGLYSGGTFGLISGVRYRLHIHTAGGSEYLSDYTTMNISPAIDSVTWLKTNDGVSIQVNTRNSADASRYYRWDFVETFNFHSAYQSSLEYVNGTIIGRADYQKLYSCWHTDTSTNILTGSTNTLSDNIVYHQPIEFIEDTSWKISVKYSILVNQQSIDKPTFDFLQLVKKNTEQLGGFYDIQPSEITGNVHCVNNPGEIVIGYVFASTVTSKRIFISADEVHNEFRHTGCEIWVAGQFDWGYIVQGIYIPIYQDMVHGLFISTRECADCRVHGTSTKPDYWP